MIRVTTDDKALVKAMSRLERNVRFAQVKALTQTAYAIRQEMRTEMEQVFDRPKPFTTNAVLYRKATMQDPFAVVYLRDIAVKGTPPWKYLQPQIKGGERNTKRFERALQAYGILPRDKQVTPGPAAKLDRYGNITGGQITQILSALRANALDPTQNQTARSKRSAGRRAKGVYFVMRRRDGTPMGIFKRSQDIFTEPVLWFVRRGRYGQRFDYFGVAGRVFEREFGPRMAAALAQAVR